MSTPNDTHIILDKELRRDIDAIIQRLRRGEQPTLPPLQGGGVNGNDIAPPPEELGSLRVRAGRRSRERSLALTKLQEAVMWLGMDLKAIGEENGGNEPKIWTVEMRGDERVLVAPTGDPDEFYRVDHPDSLAANINKFSGTSGNPYPHSKDPTNTVIDNTADGLKL